MTSKMTKAQTRKRLKETVNKLNKIMTFFIVNGNPMWKKCADMSEQCAKMADKLK